jgi:transposase-like protein
MGNPRGMRRDFEALEKRRMAAVRLFPTDLNNSEIGRRLKIGDQTVSRWRMQYRSEVSPLCVRPAEPVASHY